MPFFGVKSSCEVCPSDELLRCYELFDLVALFGWNFNDLLSEPLIYDDHEDCFEFGRCV